MTGAAGRASRPQKSHHQHGPTMAKILQAPGPVLHLPSGVQASTVPFLPIGWTYPIVTQNTITSNLGLTVASPNPEMVRPKPDLPEVEETMPILAHRALRMVTTPQGLRLHSLAEWHDGILSVEADAVCYCGDEDDMFWGGPVPPRPGLPGTQKEAPCDRGACGFYAVPADEPTQANQGTLDAQVELSGKVIEHDKGYRAGHQRIVQVEVPGCGICGAPSVFLGIGVAGYEVSSCVSHYVPTLRRVGLDEASRIIGVPFVQV